MKRGKLWLKRCVRLYQSVSEPTKLTKRGHMVGKPYNEPIAEDQVFSL